MPHLKEFFLALTHNFAWFAGDAAQMGVYDFTGLEIYPIDNSIGLLHAADLTGDGCDTPIKNRYLNDAVAGDFNGDGRKELVFLETRQHYLGIVNFNSRHKLVPAIRWPMFEEHAFDEDLDELPEPREALVAKVTGHKDRKGPGCGCE
jgi:hypothetical protein